jgi:ribosomal protein L37AE/L43A
LDRFVCLHELFSSSSKCFLRLVCYKQLGIGSKTDQPVPVRLNASVRFSRIGCVVVREEDLSFVIRRQALYLQKELRHLEQFKLSFGASFSSSASSTGGVHRKRSGSAPHKAKKHICPKCAKPLKKGICFCVHCGYKLDGSAPASPVAIPLAQIPEENGEEQQQQQQQPEPVPSDENNVVPTIAVLSESAKVLERLKDEKPSKISDTVYTPGLKKKPIDSPSGSFKGESPSKSKLPKMSSLQQTLFDMPSPMPVQKLVEELVPERRSSLDSLHTAKVTVFFLKKKKKSKKKKKKKKIKTKFRWFLRGYRDEKIQQRQLLSRQNYVQNADWYFCIFFV